MWCHAPLSSDHVLTLHRVQDPTKVHHFLSYLFDLHNINVWLKDEWVKVLDRKFVEVQCAHTPAKCWDTRHTLTRREGIAAGHFDCKH